MLLTAGVARFDTWWESLRESWRSVGTAHRCPVLSDLLLGSDTHALIKLQGEVKEYVSTDRCVLLRRCFLHYINSLRSTEPPPHTIGNVCHW
jgi:hypothetical protein